MKTRTLGRNGPEVSAIGLGCMGMAAFYGPGVQRGPGEEVIHRALDLGVTLFDTAEMYGPHTNEVQVGKALAGRRDKAFIATKFGIGYNAERTALKVDGSPGQCAPGDRGQPEAAECRPRRSLLPAPRRSRHADRGDGGRDGRAGRRRARCGSSACRRPRPRRCARPMRPIRSRPCRPNTRCGAASPRTKSWRPAMNWASASCPTARWAGASCRERSSRSTIWRRTTSAAPIRASWARISRRTSTW